MCRGGAKYVATLAEPLDATGDAKDLAGTKLNFAKFSVVLKSIRACDPPTQTLKGFACHTRDCRRTFAVAE